MTYIPKKALIIDGENVSAEYAQAIMDECAGYGGVLSVRKVCGNVLSVSKKSNMKKWREPEIMLKYGLNIQHIEKLAEKNSSDIAMMFDIWSTVEQDNADIYILVTSDRDFTYLAHRLRGMGKTVVGLAEKSKSSQTDKNYAMSCTVFKYLNDLVNTEVTKPQPEQQEPVKHTTPSSSSSQNDGSDSKSSSKKSKNDAQKTKSEQSEKSHWTNELHTVIDQLAKENKREDGYIRCSDIGTKLKTKKCPSYKELGYKRLLDWLADCGYKTTSEKKDNNPKTDYIVYKAK